MRRSSPIASAMTGKTAIKQHLDLLELERVVAQATTLGDDPVYMADLEEEILVTRHAFVGSAVLEIALLRAELDGPDWG
jgi:hypothetical protein